MSKDSLNQCACPKPPGGILEVVFRGRDPYCCTCGGVVLPAQPSPTLTPEKRKEIVKGIAAQLEYAKSLDISLPVAALCGVEQHVAAWREDV
jgi:hypothetical protein